MSTDYPRAENSRSDAAAEVIENPLVSDSEFDEDEVLYEEQVKPEYGILGFTLRELIIVGLWVLAFITSFFPVYRASDASIWASGISWIVPIGLPTVAVFLIVLRRLSPQGIRRVGSLGIDQFASVVFSFAALSWAQFSWDVVAASVATRTVLPLWVNWVQLALMLGLVAVTVFAPLIPALREDFRGRLATLAHRNANPVRPVIPRPKPVNEPAVAAVDSPSAQADHESPTLTAPPFFDVELSGENTTDQISRADLAAQVPLTAHASGGDTGTQAGQADDELVPPYSRRSRASHNETVAESAPEAAPEEDARDESETGEAQSADEATDHGVDNVAESAIAVEPTEDSVAELAPESLQEASTAEQESVELAPHTVADQPASTDLSAASGSVPSEEVPAAEAPRTERGDAAVLVDDEDLREEPKNETAETEVFDSVSSLAELFNTGPIVVDSDEDAELQEAEHDIDSTRPRVESVTSQPFWALAPTERDVMDERGNPLFRIGPTAWALVLEDRGGAFVVRHDDGRIGYLHDISDITKG